MEAKLQIEDREDSEMGIDEVVCFILGFLLGKGALVHIGFWVSWLFVGVVEDANE